MGDAIQTRHAKRFNDILSRADDELFLRYFNQILEHFKPKLVRSDETKNVKQEINVNFRRRD